MNWFLVILGGLGFFLLVQTVMRWVDRSVHPAPSGFIYLFKTILANAVSDNDTVRGSYRGHGSVVSFTYGTKSGDTFDAAMTVIVRMGVPPSGMGSFSIIRETAFSGAKRLIGKGDPQTGDVRFDRTFLLASDDPYALAAILNSSVRKNLLKLNTSVFSLSLTNELFMVELPRPSRFGKATRNALDVMADIVESIAAPETVRDRLTAIVQHDPMAAVRKNCLETLIEIAPMDDTLRALLETAKKDLNIGVKIAAVRALKGEHHSELERALRERKKLTDAERAELLSALNENRYDIPVKTLIDVSRRTNDAAVLGELMRACTIPGSEKLHPFLTDYLDRRKSKVSVEMIRQLGSVGTVETVERLYRFRDKSLNPFVRGAVADAIAAIQSRLGIAERGWLSTAGLRDTDGALSRADGAAEGALSDGKSDPCDKKPPAG